MGIRLITNKISGVFINGMSMLETEVLRLTRRPWREVLPVRTPIADRENKKIGRKTGGSRFRPSNQWDFRPDFTERIGGFFANCKI